MDPAGRRGLQFSFRPIAWPSPGRARTPAAMPSLLDERPGVRTTNHTLSQRVKRVRLGGSNRTHALLFFLAVFGVYASLTPGAIGGMGYNAEELRAGAGMIEALKQKVSGTASPSAAIQPCRNGYVTVVLDLPTLLLASVLPGNTAAYWGEVTIALQACLLAALLAAVLFRWLLEILESARTALFLGLLAAFATLYWPYAYIGLEVKASLFLMLTAWIALAGRHPSAWKSVIGFSLAAGLALSVKSNGVMLLPAVAFLGYRYFVGMKACSLRPVQLWFRAAVLASIPILLAAAGWATRIPFWNQFGGTLGFASAWAAWGPQDVLLPAFNFAGLLGAPNKGLFVYVPATLLALWVMPRIWDRHRDYAVFALLTLLGVAGGSSLVRFWTDETWGPRYLHVAIGPLILCLGLSLRERVHLLMRIALAGAFLWGGSVAALGSLFFYGSLHQTAIRSGQSTIEALQGDIVWNHILFNGRLLQWWLNQDQPALWSPAHMWFYEPAPDARPWPVLDMRPLAKPQAVLTREWNTPMEGLALRLWRIYAFSGIIGLLMLGFLILRVCRPLGEVARSELDGHA